jgi:formate--tetrahydrofolate ligase
VKAVLSEVWAKGSEGGTDLAREVVRLTENNEESRFKFLYDPGESIRDKVEKIAREIYGADGVEFTSKAEKDIKLYEKLGLDSMPVCMAKTQYSLSDNPKLLGRPTGFKITVREIRVSAGAGFLVVLTGDVMTMPGLPKIPAATRMNIDKKGSIEGLF